MLLLQQKPKLDCAAGWTQLP